ncbi:hypothetical protein IMZ48_41000 [Candidatus Bathyarchaeota archaeon]|nr:hypothetical protein [Candidatus Bathyarchaeota archaeon]
MSTNGSNKPTKLHIATQAVVRLLKERAFYHKEVETEKAKIIRLRAALAEKIAGGVVPDPEENEEYLIDQRVRYTPPPPHLSLSYLLSRVSPDYRKETVLTYTQERAIRETEGIFGPLGEKIEKAAANLEDAIGAADGATPEEKEKAKKAVEDAKAALSA